MNESLLMVDEEDTMKGKFLTFNLGYEYYGIGINFVTEIVGIQNITEVPELPDCIKGIINLRGEIFPIMDARARFKKKAIEYNDRTCIIVVELNDISLGIVVDEVSEVVTIPDENIVPPPEIGQIGKKYISNIAKYDDGVILIVDCDALLDEEELSTIKQSK